MQLPDKIYDILKWVMLLIVPIGAFIISIITAIQTGDIVAIITAITTGIESLIGIIIKISDSTYKKSLATKAEK